MRNLIFIFVLICTGCAERLQRHSPIGGMISAHLASRQTCIRLPGDGDWTVARGDEVLIRGFPGSGGGLVYPDKMNEPDQSIRAAYDLLTDLGLYTVDELPPPDSGPGWIRRYRATSLGEAHIRLVPGGHGESGWYGLCYGQRRLVAIEKFGAIKYAPAESRADLLYLCLCRHSRMSGRSAPASFLPRHDWNRRSANDSSRRRVAGSRRGRMVRRREDLRALFHSLQPFERALFQD